MDEVCLRSLSTGFGTFCESVMTGKCFNFFSKKMKLDIFWEKVSLIKFISLTMCVCSLSKPCVGHEWAKFNTLSFRWKTI